MVEAMGDTNPPVTPVIARGDRMVVPQASEATHGWFTAYFNAGGSPMEGLLGDLSLSQAPGEGVPARAGLLRDVRMLPWSRCRPCPRGTDPTRGPNRRG